MSSARVPLPSPELARRVGTRDIDHPLAGYEEFGKQHRDDILALLPDAWSFEGRRVLDFGCGAGRVLRHFLREAEEGELHGCDIDAASIDWLERHLTPPLHVFQNAEEPPLPLPDGSFDLVWAISVFTHLTDSWSRWLLELHRLLRDDGLLIATFLGRGMYERTLNEPWDEDRIGMNVLRHGRSWDHGGPLVFLSPWWISDHWGRAFEVVTLWEAGFGLADRRDDGQGAVLLRKRSAAVDPQQLERIRPEEPRELEALRNNIRQLHAESKLYRASWEKHNRVAAAPEAGHLPREGDTQALGRGFATIRAFPTRARGAVERAWQRR